MIKSRLESPEMTDAEWIQAFCQDGWNAWNNHKSPGIVWNEFLSCYTDQLGNVMVYDDYNKTWIRANKK